MTLEYPTSGGFGLKDQRSTLELGLTAIRCVFELYEYLLVQIALTVSGNGLLVQMCPR